MGLYSTKTPNAVLISDRTQLRRESPLQGPNQHPKGVTVSVYLGIFAMAERGGFSSRRLAHPFENAENPHTTLTTQGLASFPLRLSRTGKSAWCSPKIDTK